MPEQTLQRPSLDSYIMAPQSSSRPSLDSYISGGNKTEVRAPSATLPKKKEPMQILPTKEDLPGLGASALHGLTGGLTDAGRMTESYAMGGYGNQAMRAGENIARKFTGLPARPDPNLNEKYGVPVLPQPKSLVGKVAGAGIEALTGAAPVMALEKAGPALQRFAIDEATKVIRPVGRLAPRSDKIAKTAIESGVLRSSPKRTAEAAQTKINNLMDEIDTIASGIKNKTVTAENAGRRMDALSKWYRQRGDTNAAEKIDSIKADIIRGEGLTEPVMQTVHTPLDQPENGFVIARGSPSTQTTPSVQNVPLASKSKRPILKSVQSGEVPSKQNLESAEDVILQQRGKNQVRMVAPERKTSTVQSDIRSPAIEGPATPSQVQVGTKYKGLPVRKALEVRRNQDALLKSKKINGGFGSDTNSSEILGRQEFANGMRREIGNAVPEIGEKNRQVSKLIDVSTAAGKRAQVSNRNDRMSLKDALLLSNPKMWPVLLGKYAYGPARGLVARGAYGAGEVASRVPAKTIAQAIAARRMLEYAGQ